MKNYQFNCLFTDICGNLKEKIVYANSKEDFLSQNIHFDGSSVLGYNDTDKSDALLIPDRNAFVSKNIVFCDVKHPSDSRLNLKETIKTAKSQGYNIKIGAEIEFYLFKKQNGFPDTSIRDKKNYMSCCSLRIHDWTKQISKHLARFGIQLESIHHEVSNNQYEINFKFGDPLEVADRVVFIKQELKWISEKLGAFVSFMPKPFENSAGSGMHINLSIFQNNKNIFDNNGVLDENAIYFSNGVMNHISAITAYSCPSINSYKRLGACNECPNKIFMSKNNRNALIRIPDANGNATRIEIRSPDISANPYTTFLSIIEAGIDGIKNKAHLENEGEPLPKTLSESLIQLKSDQLLTSKFPELTKKYIEIKELELDDFNRHITDFELKRYF